jgi:hypothetical protein
MIDTSNPRFQRILYQAVEYQIWRPIIEAARKGQLRWARGDETTTEPQYKLYEALGIDS